MMKSVTESQYREIVSWLREMDNYVGTNGHSVDSTEHYVLVGGERKVAAQDFYNDLGRDPDTFYEVNESALAQWRAANPKKIVF